MRRTHVAGLDYEQLAYHLQHNYDPGSQDDALPDMAIFHHYRGVLVDHVDRLMDEREDDRDPTLTQIMLRDYLHGAVVDVHVTHSAGRVVRSEGQVYTLPLVLIEVEY
jgi:hypothetical protein